MRNLLLLVLSAVVISVSACSSTSSPTTPTPPVSTPSCTYSLGSTTLSLSGAGATGSIGVTAGTGCAWTVSSSASFVILTSPTSQTGNGAVTFTVPENTGDTRSGTLTIANQAVTVTQVTGDQVYGNWGGNIIKGSGCAAALPASLEWTGVIRRTSGATNELVITIPGLVTAQTLALTLNGSSVQFFVPIDTLYTFNGTLSADRRSLTGTFSGGGCLGTWHGTRR